MDTSWNERAAKLAQYVGEHMFPAHRGAIQTDEPGVFVVFGNDGYDNDRRVDYEVELTQQTLQDLGYDVLGFGDSGASWALVVSARSWDLVASPDCGCSKLIEAVWDAWDTACGSTETPRLADTFRGLQTLIAEAEIHNHTPLAV